MPLLEVRNLKKYFAPDHFLLESGKEIIRAVDDVSFSMEKGETLGLVGESGSGKTTVGHCILRLIEPDSGEVFFRGEDLLRLSTGDMRRKRREMQIIFQDPYGSLNPRMKVGKIIEEPLAIHSVGNVRERRDRVVQLLETVGLESQHGERYPHEFSAGQRQRIGIARSLALNPDFIVADEPVSALDLATQSQILDLLHALKSQLQLTMLFISHSLPVVRNLCDRVAVMYRGRIVEIARTEEMFQNPVHRYTKELLQAIPEPDPKRPRRRSHE